MYEHDLIYEEEELLNQDVIILVDTNDKHYPGIKSIRFYMADIKLNYDECCKVLGLEGDYVKVMFKELFLLDLCDLYGAERAWNLNNWYTILNEFFINEFLQIF